MIHSHTWNSFCDRDSSCTWPCPCTSSMHTVLPWHQCTGIAEHNSAAVSARIVIGRQLCAPGVEHTQEGVSLAVATSADAHCRASSSAHRWQRREGQIELAYAVLKCCIIRKKCRLWVRVRVVESVRTVYWSRNTFEWIKWVLKRGYKAIIASTSSRSISGGAIRGTR